MTEVHVLPPQPADMRVFAEKLTRLMLLDPSTGIKQWLKVVDACMPPGAGHFHALYEIHERNVGRLQEVGKRAIQLAEEVTTRQRDILGRNSSDSFDAFCDILAAGTPVDAVARQARYLKEMSMRAVDNSETVSKQVCEAQRNIAQLLCNRMGDWAIEMNVILAPKQQVH